MNKTIIFGVGGVIAVALFLIFTACQTVPAGHVGVKTIWGAVEPGVLSEGIHTVNPFSTDVEVMEIRVRKKVVKASASSKDLQTVTSNIALNYRIDPQKADVIFQKIGLLRMVESTIIDPVLQEGVKTATARYTAEQLITQRQEVKNQMVEYVTTALAKNNIEVTDLSITNFAFDDSFQQAIEAKQVAEQAALQAKNDLERIKTEAEQEKAKAVGRAAARLAEAKAEAQAQELLQKTITPQIIRLRTLEKWDGKMPEVYGGGNGDFIIDVMRK